MKVLIKGAVGSNFAENKEEAKRLRTQLLLPALECGEDVELDFQDITLATQSFIHALIAEAIRDPKVDALEHLSFANCSDNVRSIVEIVVSYAQDDWSSLEDLSATADDASPQAPGSS